MKAKFHSYFHRSSYNATKNSKKVGKSEIQHLQWKLQKWLNPENSCLYKYCHIRTFREKLIFFQNKLSFLKYSENRAQIQDEQEITIAFSSMQNQCNKKRYNTWKIRDPTLIKTSEMVESRKFMVMFSIVILSLVKIVEKLEKNHYFFENKQSFLKYSKYSS